MPKACIKAVALNIIVLPAAKLGPLVTTVILATVPSAAEVT